MVRRKKLMLATAGGGLVIAVAAAWLVLAAREEVEQYSAGESVEGITSELTRHLPPDHPRLELVDVTREAGIRFTHFGGTRSTQLPEDMGPGAAWGDVDGDGDEDLFLPNFSGPLDVDGRRQADAPVHGLFLNRGDGTFEDASARSGLGVPGTAIGAAFGDVDGDRDLDLVVTQFGRSRLFLNAGDGTFDDASEESGIAGPEGFWTGASWADVEGDGDLDLLVCGYVRYVAAGADRSRSSEQYGAVIPYTLNPSSFQPERNLLFVNDGTGRFTERAEAAGVDNVTGRSLSASWADLDEDGDLDLYVANDVSDNALYLNRGDGTFEDVSHQAWVADYRGAMGLAVGDHDGDLDLDLFVTHWVAQENALYRSLLADTRGSNEGPLRYVDVADGVGLGQVALSLVGWGTDFIDVENDGRPDLFVVNGSTLQEADDPSRLVPMRDALYWNAGEGRGFFDVSVALGPALQAEHVGRGLAACDHDRDGDVDLLITNHGGSPTLLRNDGGNAASWLQVALRGERSNTFGVGARVEVEAGGHRQVRVVGASSSYLSQSSLVASFGMGDAAVADVVEVRWPSGHVDTMRDVPARRRIEVTEGGSWRALLTQPQLDERGAVILSGQAGTGGGADKATLRDFWTHYRRARQARQDGALEAAVEAYRSALAVQPAHDDALYWLGNTLLELGRPSEAAEAWRRLVDQNPMSARGHQQLGAVHSMRDAGTEFDLERSELAFRRAAEINPEESGPLMRLGEVLLARGRHDEARDVLGHASRLNPQLVSPHYLLAHLAWTRGQAGEAVEHLDAALAALGPDVVPIEGGTAEGDVEDELKRLQAEARRKSLFGPAWQGLGERLSGGAVDEAAAAAESGRVAGVIASLQAATAP